MATTLKKTRGKLAPPAPTGTSAASSPLISDAKLKQLYAAMLQCNMLRERMQRPDKTGSRPTPSLAAEAAVVGTAVDLRRDDWLAPFENEVLGRFIKGVPLSTILADCKPAKPAKHPANKVPLAAPLKGEPAPPAILPKAANPTAQLNLASGIALALKAGRTGNVVMAFFGDVSDGGQRWYEALTFAGKHCLPLLVVMHCKASPSPSRADKGKPFPNLLAAGQACEVPVIPVDADDVVAIYRVAYEAIHKARHGGGPTLIQAVSFSQTQSRKANKAANDHPDAIARMESYLTAKGLFSASWKQKLVDDFYRDLSSVVLAGRRSPVLNR